MFFFYVLAIRTGRYSYEVHTQNIEEVKSRKIKENPNLTHTSSPSDSVTSFPYDASIPNAQVTTDTPSLISETNQANYSQAHPFTRVSQDMGLVGSKKTTSASKHSKEPYIDKSLGTIYSDDENALILQNLLTAQEAMLEDLDEFLDELKLQRRKREYVVSCR